MQLKRLIIQGFKSFKDRTIINFDDGITGIVGPNGCGKSNIVDALFWIMGEQSAKHLRGNSMKDLIFAGSSKYNPAAWAEATLVLENTNGKHIHIGGKVANPSEIQLTRKLYRNGDTEYRINGEPARLKDIQEVFMDTGAGAKSYSIIAQGEINRLVQAKPVERRTMIEEVAGITKFKVRKKESMRKIEATEQNLNRLNDLTIEIEKNLKSLQKQAEKAERARTLKDRIKRTEISVVAHKVFEDLRELRDGSTELLEKKSNLEEWSMKKDSLEISLEEERFEREEKTARIDESQKERNEVSNKLAAAEERLNALCKSLTDKEEQLEQRQKEIDELAQEIEERLLKKEEIETEINDVITSSKEDYDYEEASERLETLKSELEDRQAQISELEEELSIKKEELVKMDQQAFQNNSKLEEYAATLQDLATEIEAIEKQYSGVSSELAKERDDVMAAKNLVEELSESELTLKETVSELTQKDRDLESELKNLTKEQITKQSRLSSLKEIRSSLEGAKEGVSKFLSEVDSDKYTVLGNIIKCDDKYTKAVTALLGEFLESLVTSESDLSLLKNWVTENDENALEILLADKSADIISAEARERIQVKLGSELITLSDIIELPEEYKAKLTPYLSSLFIVETLDVDKVVSLESSISFGGISDISGNIQVRNRQNATVLHVKGSGEQGQSAIERNNTIETLENELVSINEKVTNLEEEVAASNELLRNKISELEDSRLSLSESRADYAAKNSALESKLASMESGNTRLEILKNRKDETSKLRLAILEKEESFNKDKSEVEEFIADISERVQDLRDSYNEMNEVYEADREVYVSKQVEAKTFEQRVTSLRSQSEDIEKQIEKQNLRKESNTELITKLEGELENMQVEIEELEISNNEKADILASKDEVLSIMKDEFSELLLAMQEREDQVKELSKNINKADKEIAEKEVRLERCLNEEEENVRNIFEKYRVDLRESIGRYLEYTEVDFEKLNDVSTMYFMETESGPKEVEKESYEFVRKYGQDLKDQGFKLKNYKSEFGRLGEINWQAIEDYDRQKLRYDFLKVQEVELRKSLEDLQNAINHIDEKSKERFKVAFEEVDTRFRKVFPIIFGGGEARLEIVGDIDDAECGVDIIAKPPGKKMQNINLMSGGEKAMTAVSLIFSIFLVKPSPFCLLDEVDAPLDDANVGRFNELLREMSAESQFILITHNKKTMELNDTLYGVTMQEPGVSKAVSVQLQ
ncbi:chromosome segregation protein SMC [Bacteriovorax sp. BAL6_X]|uniref:chromosome segregation protein SMC n=1 Tax=Bacteriovorax sp. BAL6_X TaxID=1201290 RepID=UPI0003859623|nr:chromosome segregation protein SMC [Bacteriovorax sp. BAL6_X]EPZ52238.1 chromosome segregation protein SMC [Bacteriovorax sp. BAL6_X]